MNRRNFIQRSGAGVLMLALPDLPRLPQLAVGVPMGVVVHSYWARWNSKVVSTAYPAFTNALELLDHCHQIGAGGVQVVVNGWSDAFARSVRDRREKLGMYLEGSISVPKKADDVAAFERDVIRAKEAGAQILRTVCSSGRRYEILHSPEAFVAMRQAALTSLQLAEPVLRKHGVRLAVENHKDWRAPELVAILKQLDSEWIGVTLDFGNSMALLEDPMTVVQTLAPYVFSTHVKDMAVEDYADGFLLSEVPLGEGLLDLPKMAAVCKQHNPAVTFSLEMITRDPLEVPCLTPDYWATFGDLPATELAWMLHTARQHKPAPPLPRTTPLSPENRLALEEKNIVSCLAYSRGRLEK
ncbi:sugar phosphate isomerase/epimerase family protein [Fibrella aquatilis]|uniref:TIM barrel protein n=1 Tax=Fibrella aquatilis TaxID=2817059 RepID=A0A939GBK6_9BACT|nr:TIM barrel protein [Fibrella aquatilis]MBO0934798.1 TIM barrel protein [Fibrella aquatilis]